MIKRVNAHNTEQLDPKARHPYFINLRPSSEFGSFFDVFNVLLKPILLYLHNDHALNNCYILTSVGYPLLITPLKNQNVHLVRK